MGTAFVQGAHLVFHFKARLAPVIFSELHKSS